MGFSKGVPHQDAALTTQRKDRERKEGFQALPPAREVKGKEQPWKMTCSNRQERVIR